ncbi:MAG: hypothetical protein C4523_20605 [Myxococcales bacterium]|nr:MAG: hypothetical protein C4523_20605 [Myxococcales bacterium]
MPIIVTCDHCEKPLKNMVHANPHAESFGKILNYHYLCDACAEDFHAWMLAHPDLASREPVEEFDESWRGLWAFLKAFWMAL